jgi:hypothetical protein
MIKKNYDREATRLAFLLMCAGWVIISIGHGILFSSVSLPFLMIGVPIFIFGVVGLCVEVIDEKGSK